MPITLNCPKCHKPFRVRDESIGGRVRCPSCASILQVPSSLAPASHFGFDMPQNVDINPAEMTGAHRPIAEDVQLNPPGGDLLGNTSRPPQMEFGSAGVALPAPPSIKFRGAPSVLPHGLMPGSNPNSPLSNIPVAPNPAGSRFDPPSQSTNPAANQANLNRPQSSYIQLPPTPQSNTNTPAATTNVNPWASVRSGLSMIQAGLFLWMIPFIGLAAHAAWGYQQPAQAFNLAPGYLQRADLPFWKEIALGYTAVPMTLGLLLLLFGRIKCTSAPDASTTRGLARGAVFCTILGFIGAAAAVAFFGGYLAKFNLPPQTGWLAIYVWLPAAVLADLFTLLFIAQAGWVAGLPRLLLHVGTFLTYILVVPAILAAAHLFFPIIEPFRDTLLQTNNPFGNADAALTQKFIIGGGAVLLYGFLIFARYFMLAGKAKQAIRAQFG